MSQVLLFSCLLVGFALLATLSLLFGNEIADVELPLLGRVPFTMTASLAIGLYGAFGLVLGAMLSLVGLGSLLNGPGLPWLLAVSSVVVSWRAARFLSELLIDRPEQPFESWIVGRSVIIGIPPGLLSNGCIGDAVISDGNRGNVVIRVVLPDYAQDALKSGDVARVISSIPDRGIYQVVKEDSLDSLR